MVRTDKSLRVFGLEESILDKILAKDEVVDLKFLADFEKGIADLVKIPRDSVIVVPPMSHHRFVPEDVKVYGRDGKIEMLSNFYPHHFAAMQEYGRSHHLLRISVFPEYRDKVSDNADKIKDYLMGFAK
jgi:hypothetical protein